MGVADGQQGACDTAIVIGAVSARGFDPRRSRQEHHEAPREILILRLRAELPDRWSREP